MKNNDLIDYRNIKLDYEEKNTIVITLVLDVIAVFLIALGIINSWANYGQLISLTLGAIVAIYSYYHLIIKIKSSPVALYKKVVRKEYMLHLLLYVIAMVLSYLTNFSLINIIDCLVGLLNNKIAIYIYQIYLNRKKKVNGQN